MAEYVKLEVLNQSNLDNLLSTDPEMEQMLRSCIRKAIVKARSGAVQQLKGKVGTGYEHSHGDPRDAYKAVKHMIYKRELGGNISILNKRKATNQRLSGKGTNTYYGSDRGFILRFLNSGAVRKRRGAISPSRMFSNIGQKLIEEAATEVNQMVMERIETRANEI